MVGRTSRAQDWLTEASSAVRPVMKAESMEAFTMATGEKLSWVIFAPYDVEVYISQLRFIFFLMARER